MQIWVWPTGEGAAVYLLGGSFFFQQGAWTWLARYQSPPTGAHKLLWHFVDLVLLIANLDCLPLCVSVGWSAQQIVYSSKASFGAFDLLLLYWSLMLFCFCFIFKEILKHILTTAENFLNRKMEGGFRQQKTTKKQIKKTLQRTKVKWKKKTTGNCVSTVYQSYWHVLATKVWSSC